MRTDGPLAAGLAPQQARQEISLLAYQLGIGELNDLPSAVGTLDSRSIGARNQCAVRDRMERTAIKLHAKIHQLPTSGRSGRQIFESLPNDGRRKRHADLAKAQAVARRPYGHRPRPRV